MRSTYARVAALAGCVVLAAASAWPAGAAADEGGASYDETIEIALGHYRERDWAAARAAFERAHTIEPSARALRGVALSAYYAKDYVTAATAFESALAEPQRPLSAEQRTQAEQLLQSAYGFVAQVDLELLPADASVRLNEQDVAQRKRLLLDPGHYRIDVSLAGYAPYTEELELKAGQQLKLRIALSLAPELTATSAPVAKVATPAPAPAPERQVSSVAPLIAVGATLALSATAVIFAIMASNEFDDLAQKCRRDGCTEEHRAALWDDSPITTYETVTNVALAAAAGGAIATTVLFVLSRDSRTPARSELEASGSRLRLSLRF